MVAPSELKCRSVGSPGLSPGVGTQESRPWGRLSDGCCAFAFAVVATFAFAFDRAVRSRYL